MFTKGLDCCGKLWTIISVDRFDLVSRSHKVSQSLCCIVCILGLNRVAIAKLGAQIVDDHTIGIASNSSSPLLILSIEVIRCHHFRKLLWHFNVGDDPAAIAFPSAIGAHTCSAIGIEGSMSHQMLDTASFQFKPTLNVSAIEWCSSLIWNIFTPRSLILRVFNHSLSSRWR